jgi:hypothetical protein
LLATATLTEQPINQAPNKTGYKHRDAAGSGRKLDSIEQAWVAVPSQAPSKQGENDEGSNG